MLALQFDWETHITFRTVKEVFSGSYSTEPTALTVKSIVVLVIVQVADAAVVLEILV
jgi:hypothetical protein